MPKSSYTIKQKLEVLIDLRDNYDNNASAYSKAKSIPMSSLKDWRKLGISYFEEQINSGKSYKRLVLVQERRGKFVKEERILYESFLDRERYRMVRDDKWLITEAKKIWFESNPAFVTGDDAFKFSTTWLKAFKKRFRISSRRTVNKKIDVDSFLSLFVQFIISLRRWSLLITWSPESSLICPAQWWNTDETPMYLPNFLNKQNCSADSNSRNEISGVKFTVDIEKRWCTLVVSVRGDNYTEERLGGYSFRKMPVVIIFRGAGGDTKAKKNEAKEYDSRVKVVWQSKGWFDRDVGKEFVSIFRSAVPPRTSNIYNLMLVDNLDGHIEENFVSGMYRNCNTYVKALPPNTTHFSQPVDRHVGQTLKKK